ncbi:MAG: LPS assembly lipoprotein LptE [Pseudobdellovibrionaceae bacterium]
MKKTSSGKSIFTSVWLCVAIGFVLSGCYHLGYADRKMVGDAKLVSIPMFKNITSEPGIEVAFTTQLIQEFNRSDLVKVVDGPSSDVQIQGTLTSLEYLAGGIKTSDPDVNLMPLGTVLASEYRILLLVSVQVVRTSNKEVIWSTEFSGEKTYPAPQVTLAGVNSVNPLYNLSARRQNIQLLAVDMMSALRSRLTENF